MTMKLLRRFFNTKSNWINFFTLVLTFIACVISFIHEQFLPYFLPYQIIATMLFLIAGENFIKQLTHMEDIKEKLDSLKLQTEFKDSRKSLEAIPSKIKSAQNEVFITGMNMESWGGMIKDDLKEHIKDLKLIRILVLNLDDTSLKQNYEKMRGAPLEGPPTAEFFLKGFLGHKNVEIRIINRIMPIVFFAKDMNEPGGYILAVPLSNTEHDNKLLNLEFTPTDKWYENYHQQIEELWKSGEDYHP